jgi:hypothetical protein
VRGMPAKKPRPDLLSVEEVADYLASRQSWRKKPRESVRTVWFGMQMEYDLAKGREARRQDVGSQADKRLR